MISPRNKKCVISISFSDYIHRKSGMPKVIMGHQRLYNESNVSYIYLFSIKKNVLNDKMMLFCQFVVIVDGEYCGVYSIDNLCKLLCNCVKSGYSIIDIHLHHLLYMKLEYVRRVIKLFPLVPIKFFVHDYYLCCSNYTLINSNDEYCGGAGLSKDCCADCAYYDSSVKQEKVLHGFIAEFVDRILFVTPSETTKRIFLNFNPQYSNVIVIPHQVGRGVYGGNGGLLAKLEPIKIAFLGMPAFHKGWKIWEKIVKMAPSNDYLFYVFNSSDDEYDNCTKVKIGFTQNNLSAMTNALRENGIHVVAFLSGTPETYSYTCMEAFAANAFVLTRSISGNIADFVLSNGIGEVFDNEEDLIGIICRPDLLRERVNSYRKKHPETVGEMIDNHKIVDISLSQEVESAIIDDKRVRIHNPVLNIILNKKMEKVFSKAYRE